MNPYERAVGEAALQQMGKIPNIIKAVEELSELQHALCRYMVRADEINTEAVYEEMADVEIMLGRLKMMIDPDEVQIWKDRKLERTGKLMGVEVARKGDDLFRHGCAVPPSPEGEGMGRE